MLRAFLERRRITKTLGRYVTPDIARQLADGTLTAPDPAQIERCIEVVFIAITARDAADYSIRASTIADIGIQHGGVVHSLLPVVIVAFGSLHAAPAGSRLPFVASIPAGTAILHGSIAASVGSFGGDQRCEFGFWWPGALDALRQLAALSPGEVRELQSQ